MRYVLGIEIAKNEFNFLGLFSRNSPVKYFDDTDEEDDEASNVLSFRQYY